MYSIKNNLLNDYFSNELNKKLLGDRATPNTYPTTTPLRQNGYKLLL